MTYNEDGHSATGNPYLFQGRRWDSEVSLYYFRHRAYSPVLGRFLQRDPAGHVKTEKNLYVYSGSRPTFNVDPFGLVECRGGKWWFSGTFSSGSFFVGSYTKAVGTFTCKQRKRIGYYEYDCGELGCILQDIYRVPTCRGSVTTWMAGPGLGGKGGFVLGSVSGAEDSDSLRGWSLEGPNVSLSLIVTIGASTSGGTGGAGSGLGFNFELVGASKTKLYACYKKHELESLMWTEKQILDKGLCTKKSLHLETPEWVDTPEPAKPWEAL